MIDPVTPLEAIEGYPSDRLTGRCHTRGNRMSTSLTTTISGKRPVEDPCCSSRVEAEAGYNRSEDRLSTVDHYKCKDRLEEEDRGSTTRPIEDLLEEEYRGISKKRTKDRLQESNRGLTTRVEPRKDRLPKQSRKPNTTRTDYKNTTRRLLIQSIGESPLFDCWIEQY